MGKIKPVATIVAQFAAGVEVDAIQHNGKLYLPCIDLGDFATSDDAPKKDAKPSSAAKAPVDEEEVEAKVTKPSKTTAKLYKESELMEMEPKELLKILKGLGVNPDEFEGKNTNKKLRLLVLENQEDGASDEKEEKEEKPTKKGKTAPTSDEDDEVLASVITALENLDSGAKNAKKTLAILIGLGVEDTDEDAVSKLVQSFEEDSEADIDDIAAKITSVLKGEKPAKKEKKGKKKEVFVEPEDLEVGQRVSVYWEDQEEWFDGEVTSIKKGKVTIDYDDDTQEVLDENNTKIKLLSE